MLKRIFSRENLFALALCVLVVMLILVTTTAAPTWIYQGF
jgi:hypothetical protein